MNGTVMKIAIVCLSEPKSMITTITIIARMEGIFPARLEFASPEFSYSPPHSHV